MPDQSDQIRIEGLAVSCIIGTLPDERVEPQRVVLDVTLQANLRPAGKSDDLHDTVDYQALRERIVKHVAASQWFLMEKLAQQVAELCLDTPRVEGCRIRVTKPNALPDATVSVEITR